MTRLKNILVITVEETAWFSMCVDVIIAVQVLTFQSQAHDSGS